MKSYIKIEDYNQKIRNKVARECAEGPNPFKHDKLITRLIVVGFLVIPLVAVASALLIK